MRLRAEDPQANPGSRGHPRGLYVLAVTEVWERFSYYGMRALLVYYMTKQLAFTQAHASSIYGLYTATVWVTPFLGGVLADRRFGQHRCVVAGGLMMAAGHFMMAFEALFYPALALIAFGTGLFKPNISTQVGDLYAPEDPRRDRAYNIFYVGVNLGAFIAPLGCGTVGELFGWHYGFALAGVGMLAGLAIYLAGQRSLPPDRLEAARAALERADNGKSVSPDDREESVGSRVLALGAIAFAASFFWMAFEQQGNTIALWADTYTDRRLALGALAVTIPATWFQALNGFYIVVLTPVILALWRRRGAAEPGTLAKMVIGAVLAAVAFGLLAVAAWREAAAGPVSWGWLVVYFALITAGEVYLSPTCLSFFNRVAPARLASTMLGVWYLSLFLGSYLAGLVGTLWSRTPKPLYFAAIGLVALASAAGLLLVRAFLPAGLERRADRRVSRA